MQILHEDRCFAVCLKPAGILSTDQPGGLPDLVRAALGTEHIRTVHRLDAATGGIMVLAKTKQAASLLSAQLREGGFQKEYLAVCHGAPPKEGTLEDLLGRDSVRRMTYVVSAPGKDVQPAKLQYKVLAQEGGMSLLRVQLFTGRTHQIRVQFASRGFPLVGDRKYGKGEESGLALFACSLSFRHPFEATPLTFTHLPPDTFPWNQFVMSEVQL